MERIVRRKILNRARGRVTRPQAESERRKPVSKPSRVITINSEAQVPSNSNITLNQKRCRYTLILIPKSGYAGGRQGICPMVPLFDYNGR